MSCSLVILRKIQNRIFFYNKISNCYILFITYPFNGSNLYNFRNINLYNYSHLSVLQNKRFHKCLSLGEINRTFSKKKKVSDLQTESDEESEDEYSDNIADDLDEDGIITKSIISLRLDSVLKVALGISKKRIEKEFYSYKIRLDGKPVLKKATMIYAGCELDLVKGYVPGNFKLLSVDRIIVKSIDKFSGNEYYRVKMQILKSLVIENYNIPWTSSNTSDVSN